MKLKANKASGLYQHKNTMETHRYPTTLERITKLTTLFIGK
jgi:hypothetical protein